MRKKRTESREENIQKLTNPQGVKITTTTKENKSVSFRVHEMAQ